MVTGNTDEIKLVLTVDKADIERQLSKGFDASVGKSPAGRSGGGMSASDWAELKAGRAKKSLARDQAELSGMRPGGGGGKKAPKVNPGGAFFKVLGPLAALGIMAGGIMTMVKNSKVMATTMGAFKTILGAFADLFMLMFMPIITDILRWLVKMLPMIQAWTEKWGPKIVEWIRFVWKAISEEFGPWIKALYDFLKPIVEDLYNDI